jgi:hypothetical protein
MPFPLLPHFFQLKYPTDPMMPANIAAIITTHGLGKIQHMKQAAVDSIVQILNHIKTTRKELKQRTEIITISIILMDQMDQLLTQINLRVETV